MTYLKEGTEYLLPDEVKVYEAVKYLNRQNRTTNNSQVANASGVNRTKTAEITAGLRQRGYLADKGKGAAYHWRTTDKEVHPWDAEPKDALQEIDEAFARLKVLEDAYRRNFPDGRLGPPREDAGTPADNT